MSDTRSSDPGIDRDGADADTLFERLPDDTSARERLVEIFLPLAEGLARRYRGYGEPIDDLTQVASIGLLKAIDRFDLSRGVPFSGYATPTILGELKRHFRDKTWSVRMPRHLQENAVRLRGVMDGLAQSLGRSPTIASLAETSGLTEEEVLEASEALQAYSTASLDAPIGEGSTLAETISSIDHRLDLAEGWADLAPAIRELPERDRQILVMRFFEGLTQTEIAEHVGVSQMHVSRLLSRAIDELRDGLKANEPGD